jgi:hypothetical protein
MSPKQKKVVIAFALGLSSLLMIWLLLNTKSNDAITISDLAVIDSLVVDELESYSIRRKQIKTKTIKVGDFSRVNYEVRIPRELSKMQIHADIHYRMYDLGILSPAQLMLPERNLTIYLSANETVIRTIQLISDTTFKAANYPASLFVITDKKPDRKLVERVRDLGEFLPIVYRTLEPEEAQQWFKQSGELYKPVYVWLNESDREDVIKSTVWLKDKLPQFETISRGITTWVDVVSASKSDAQIQLYRNSNLRGLHLESAVYLDATEGIYAYEQALRKFKQLARQDIHPILLVDLNDKSVQVLEERIVELKKMGISFHPPVFRSF